MSIFPESEMEQVPFQLRYSAVWNSNMGEIGSLTPYEFERRCDLKFVENGPYWHICSPPDFPAFFCNDSEFKQGVTQLALCAFEFKVRIVAFELMNNHLHLILAGERDECEKLFYSYRSRISRVSKTFGHDISFDRMHPNVISIDDVRALRNEIAYVHRNCLVPNPNMVPNNYLWGTGYLYFNNLLYYCPLTDVNSLTIREKRSLLHSRNTELPSHYKLFSGMISPLSFCTVNEGQMYFRNPLAYNHAIFNDYETYSKLSKRDNESSCISYEEFYYAATSICRTEFNVNTINKLSDADKHRLAQKMHDDYNATNAQLNRVLGIDKAVLNELFPVKYRK